ncbi:MAG: hypothetical protein ACK5OX_06135 [Desertimonas sp.]
MAGIELVEHLITARVPELMNPSNTIEVPLRIRVDPLTGDTGRLISGSKLAPSTRPDLEALTAPPGFCPFCADNIETATGVFDPALTAEGRIRRGEAWVFPNVLAYSEFSSVGIYTADQHFVDLPELTPTRVGDLLDALVAYTAAVQRHQPVWSSVNANYLPPAGSSLVHPHAQSAHDAVGTSVQRRLVGASETWSGGESFWTTLIAQERQSARWVGSYGRVAVFTPWAPVGFHEVWAVVEGEGRLEAMTAQDCADLGTAISAVLMTYHALNLTSFNWAIYGGGPTATDRYSLLCKIVSRSNAEPMYRSDVTYFEKLHGEAMVDLTPEEVADLVRGFA